MAEATPSTLERETASGIAGYGNRLPPGRHAPGSHCAWSVQLIRVYRICDRRYSKSAFDGEGARLYGGRWNPVGLPMVYTSGSISLAILETLVNIQDPEDLPGKLVIIPADLPDGLPLRRFDSKSLPPQWRTPTISRITQELGKRWFLEDGEVVVAVPSVVVLTESNYLINPRHTGFSRILVHKPQRLHFDPRLLGSL